MIRSPFPVDNDHSYNTQRGRPPVQVPEVYCWTWTSLIHYFFDPLYENALNNRLDSVFTLGDESRTRDRGAPIVTSVLTQHPTRSICVTGVSVLLVETPTNENV